ncbi:hypothetical protein I3842_12G116100 [Carya illinoinensis]|uniref:RING-type domain-containing protein n=1 Tax=Carya illinoinensis TaxID=32201 RepID=A0A922IXQ9_CARIL|nr:hypothetical protein I3842_12G116100 [Carya illinoinensis]
MYPTAIFNYRDLSHDSSTPSEQIPALCFVFIIVVCATGLSLLHLAKIIEPPRTLLDLRKRALENLPPFSSFEPSDLDHQKAASWNQYYCVICLEDFKPREPYQVFPYCNHIFHSHCIRQWLNFKWTCPICRTCILEAHDHS